MDACSAMGVYHAPANEWQALVNVISSTTTAKGHNSRFKCKKCSAEFTGGNSKIRCHFVPAINVKGAPDYGVRVVECKADKFGPFHPNRQREIETVTAFRQHSAAESSKKRSASAAFIEVKGDPIDSTTSSSSSSSSSSSFSLVQQSDDKSHVKQSGQSSHTVGSKQSGSIVQYFDAQNYEKNKIEKLSNAQKKDKNAMLSHQLLNMLADCNIPRSVLNRSSFRDFIKSVNISTLEYNLPYATSVNLNGSVYKDRMEGIKVERSKMLIGMDIIGGTLMSDYAINEKKNYINTAVHFSNSSTFLQSTDITNKLCQYQSTENLLLDIEIAMNICGNENIFVLCMKESNDQILQLFEEKYSNKFSQKCATQCAILLHLEFCQEFIGLIILIKDLLQFIVGHDFLLDHFKSTEAITLHENIGIKLPGLLFAVETVLIDLQHYQLLWALPQLKNWLNTQSNEIKNEYLRLRNNLMWDDNKCNEIDFFVQLQKLFINLIKITNCEKPNLHLIAYAFHELQFKFIDTINEFKKNDLLNTNIENESKHNLLIEKFRNLFLKYEKLFVSNLACAASLFNPQYLHDPFYSNFTSNFNSEENYNCAIKCIEKYFSTKSVDPELQYLNSEKIEKVKADFLNFRNCTVGTYFARAEIVELGKCGNSDEFWCVVQRDYRELGEIGRKMVNQFSGQLNSEIWNNDLLFKPLNNENDKFQNGIKNNNGNNSNNNNININHNNDNNNNNNDLNKLNSIRDGYLQIQSSYNLNNKKNKTDFTPYFEHLQSEFKRIEATKKIILTEKSNFKKKTEMLGGKKLENFGKKIQPDIDEVDVDKKNFTNNDIETEVEVEVGKNDVTYLSSELKFLIDHIFV